MVVIIIIEIFKYTFILKLYDNIVKEYINKVVKILMDQWQNNNSTLVFSSGISTIFIIFKI